jgi:hypothetical protein
MYLCIFSVFVCALIVHAYPQVPTLTFTSTILEKSDPQCNNTEFRCFFVNLVENVGVNVVDNVGENLVDNVGENLVDNVGENLRERGYYRPTKKSNYQYQNDNNKDNDEDDIIQLALTSIYGKNFEMDYIITELFKSMFHNETFIQIHSNSTINRRSAYYWDWDGSITCSSTTSTTNPSTITTSCKNTGRITQYCFSGDSTILVNMSNQFVNVNIRDINDTFDIISIDDYNSVFTTPFLSYTHYEPQIIAEFLFIILETTNLTITRNHLVYKVNDYYFCFNKMNCMELEFSDNLNIGDKLYVYDTTSFTFKIEEITNITSVYRMGIYSPFPKNSDNFLVNNVLVSPYSTTTINFFHRLHYMYAYVKSFF